MKKVDFAELAIESSTGAPLVLLREHDEPHRVLPIFIGGLEATAIALAVAGEAPPRPLTHDLMATLVESLDGHVDAAEVTELRDGSFLARLAVHGPAGDHYVDTRPSDAIALAMRVGAPLFVSESVLDEAGTLPAPDDEDALDTEAIDEAVEEFRTFLDDVDPSQFAPDDIDIVDAEAIDDDTVEADGTDDESDA